MKRPLITIPLFFVAAAGFSVVPLSADQTLPVSNRPASLPGKAILTQITTPFSSLNRYAARPKYASTKASSAARVTDANRRALQEPSTSGYLGAVQVYAYVDGTVYRLLTAPERVSDIALEPGETLIAVAAGDTVRWTVGDTTSGLGNARQTHIMIKPLAPGLETNLIITTDRRIYHLSLTSSASTAMAAVSWIYPQDSLLAISRPPAEERGLTPVASGIDPARLRFAYAISGDDPAWRPLRAFDDGRQVFIEFPESLSQGEAPPLFIIGDAGDAQLVNYRVTERFYIVDRLFDAAELRLGAKHQKVVRIARTDRSKQRRRKEIGQ